MSKYIYVCQLCGKEFESKAALTGHSKVHKPGYEQRRDAAISNLNKSSKNKSINKLSDYNDNPSYCVHCNKELPYDKRRNRFCDKRCSAAYNNVLRGPRPESCKNKIATTLRERYIKNIFKPQVKERVAKPTKKQVTKPVKKRASKPVNIKRVLKILTKCAINENIPFSPITHNTCKHCDAIFIARKKQKYCINCSSLYSNNARGKYAFSFNIYDYPDLFDLQLLSQVGFYTSKDKKRWNPDGLTRDHRVSVNESIRNNYDPYYITHPLNCELLSFNDNNKKKTRSSISYEELVLLVDQYNSNII